MSTPNKFNNSLTGKCFNITAYLYSRWVCPHIMKTVTGIFLLAIFGSCSDISKIQLHDYILNSSFSLINETNDTILIEFSDNCAKIYSPDYYTFEEWSISENKDSTDLNFNGEKFKLITRNRNELVFSNNNTGFKLIKIDNNRINPELLAGKWIEEEYSNLPASSIDLPPCPHTGKALIPGVRFTDDSAFVNDFCYTKRWAYKTNSKFGIISFGKECTSPYQWEITGLTNDTLTVNIRYRENNQIRYEENKRYLKLVAEKEDTTY